LLTESQLKKVPKVAASLREALASLDKDREFLKHENVFTDEQIDAYIELKIKESERYEQAPHPVEFDMYYNI
jgi:glutamine synthetase